MTERNSKTISVIFYHPGYMLEHLIYKKCTGGVGLFLASQHSSDYIVHTYIHIYWIKTGATLNKILIILQNNWKYMPYRMMHLQL